MKNLCLTLAFSRVLKSDDDLDAYKYIKSLGRRKAIYIMQAYLYYESHSNILYLEPLMAKVKELKEVINKNDIDSFDDFVNILTSEVSPSSILNTNVPNNDKKKIVIQFPQSPEGERAYNAIKSYSKGPKGQFVIDIVKHYYMCGQDQEFLQHRTQSMLYRMGVLYRTNTEMFRQEIEHTILPCIRQINSNIGLEASFNIDRLTAMAAPYQVNSRVNLSNLKRVEFNNW